MSSYQALYRKYRPRTFDDVIGQDHIVRTLKNAIKLNKVSHAYLFSGPRGTGKTTLAKILAKNVNCLNNVAGNSCDNCDNCLSILNNDCSDIIEIDAASNNGVEEIREIRSKINLVPNKLKYKVYIIDEVHMLSIGAFNALLKTLEEPPEHIIFILATTDLHKVPITIVSRCQCFEFKRITDDNIVDRLQQICEFEKINVQTDVLKKIAHISDGGMRDSIGVLDKLLSYCSSDNITMEDFYGINGIMDDDQVNSFIEMLKTNNIVEVLKISDYIEQNGKDFIIFVQDVMEKLRKYVLDYYLRGIDTEFPIEFLLDSITVLNKLVIELKNASNVKIMFETSIISVLIKKDNDNHYHNKKNEDEFDEVTKKEIITNNSDELIINNNKMSDEKIINIEKADINKLIVNNNLTDDIKFNSNRDRIVIDNTFATAKKEYMSEFKNNLNLIDNYKFDSELNVVANYMIDLNIRAVGSDSLVFSCKYDSILKRGIILLEQIEKLLEKIYNKHYDVAIISDNDWITEKNEFVRKMNSGEHYIYTSLNNNNLLNQNDNNLSIDKEELFADQDVASSAIKLFGEDIVKIEN